jgi:hypothetical protein
MNLIILSGRGRVLEVKQPAVPFSDPTLKIPMRGCVPLLPIKRRRCRPEIFMPTSIKDHTNYKPGKIIDLGEDQCRWVLNEDHLMCGAQKRDGSSYCAKHHERTIERVRP